MKTILLIAAATMAAAMMAPGTAYAQKKKAQKRENHEFSFELPVYVEELKKELTYPLAWGNSGIKDFDEWRAAATRPLALPSAEAFSEGHIVKFRDDCSLSEIYEAVNGRSFMLLSSSEDRTFLIDLDDEPAFSDKYKDIIEGGK